MLEINDRRNGSRFCQVICIFFNGGNVSNQNSFLILIRHIRSHDRIADLYLIIFIPEFCKWYQLAQELNLAKEALSLRQMEEFLELTRKVEENERRRMAKQEQEEKTT